MWAAWIVLCGAAWAAPRDRPFEVRDEQLLAQARLTLPATTPDTLGRGRSRWRVSLLASNSFAWTQDVPGEAPIERSFLVDGEAATLDIAFEHGLRDDLDLALRLPLRRRGGGVFDGLIDAWHRALRFASVADGDRPLFLRDAFRVEGRTRDGEPFSWSGQAGTGLGDVELSLRRRLRDGGSEGWSWALVGRLSLPTGTGPFEGQGPVAGVQAVGARRLSPRVDFFAGAGATAGGSRTVRGVGYERWRAHGFAALEWRVGRKLSLLVQSDAASRLVSDVQSYPGVHWLIHAGARLRVSESTGLDLGLTENVKSQQATADFALHAALTLRP